MHLVSFYADGRRYVYKVAFTRQAIVTEEVVFYQTAKPTVLFSRSTDIKKRLARIQFGNKIKIPFRERDLLEGNTLHNNTVVGAYAKTNVDIPELKKLNKWFTVFLLGMVTSTHNLTDVTTSLMDQNPLINKWINTFLNKADYQISEVNVSDPEKFINVPADESSIADFSSRFALQGSYSIKTGNKADASTLARFQKYYGGGSVQRKIDFVHTVSGDRTYPLSITSESSGTKRTFGLGG